MTHCASVFPSRPNGMPAFAGMTEKFDIPAAGVVFSPTAFPIWNQRPTYVMPAKAGIPFLLFFEEAWFYSC
ncbi:MAG: hypothetical protein PHD48_07110 [Alphaproteobacteria bacterium]|nr:hypothetical protein [Alphaproteobacteria bacterium]